MLLFKVYSTSRTPATVPFRWDLEEPLRVVGAIIFSLFQREGTKASRDVKGLTQGHTTSKCLNHNSQPDVPDYKSRPLAIKSSHLPKRKEAMTRDWIKHESSTLGMLFTP